MDARSDREVEEAVEEASAFLAGRGRSLAVRMAAAKTLGRLGRPAPNAIDRLREVLESTSEPDQLRAYAAWALGEMRHERSLVALQSALRRPMGAVTGHYLLEALAKHFANMSSDRDILVDVVEAMVFFAGNQKKTPPAIYDVLDAKTKTTPVNVRILARTLQARSPSATKEQKAAVYNAAFELLAKLDLIRDEIIAGRGAWLTRVKEAIRESHRAYSTADLRTRLLVVWYLGKLAGVEELARPAAEALVGSRGDLRGRPTQSPRPGLRLVAAWTLARMQLHAPGPRQALLADLLAKEVESSIIDLIGDVSSRPEEHDQLQKIFESALVEPGTTSGE
jgi:HEAT repeat protein